MTKSFGSQIRGQRVVVPRARGHDRGPAAGRRARRGGRAQLGRLHEVRPELTVGRRQRDLRCGALFAGCRFFGGYPITPSTEILQLLSREIRLRRPSLQDGPCRPGHRAALRGEGSRLLREDATFATAGLGAPRRVARRGGPPPAARAARDRALARGRRHERRGLRGRAGRAVGRQ